MLFALIAAAILFWIALVNGVSLFELALAFWALHFAIDFRVLPMAIAISRDRKRSE
jgi:hypothetical protein